MIIFLDCEICELFQITCITRGMTGLLFNAPFSCLVWFFVRFFPNQDPVFSRAQMAAPTVTWVAVIHVGFALCIVQSSGHSKQSREEKTRCFRSDNMPLNVRLPLCSYICVMKSVDDLKWLLSYRQEDKVWFESESFCHVCCLLMRCFPQPDTVKSPLYKVIWDACEPASCFFFFFFFSLSPGRPCFMSTRITPVPCWGGVQPEPSIWIDLGASWKPDCSVPNLVFIGCDWHSLNMFRIF